MTKYSERLPSTLFLEMTKCQLRNSDRLPLAAAHYLTRPPLFFKIFSYY